MKCDALVTKQLLERVEAEVRAEEKCVLMQGLRRVEPALYDRIASGIDHAVQSLEDQGVAECDAAGAADAVLRTALVCVLSLRQAHWELWRDCFVGSLLELLDPALARPPFTRSDAQAAGQPGPPGSAGTDSTDSNSDNSDRQPRDEDTEP